jgi:hypothetical protein
MFFPEPKHDWCYYFTKAELAQQMGDAQKVVSLGKEAISLGYKPTDQNEWLVFIKAFALTGDIPTAEALSAAALAEDARVRRGVCSAWEQVQANGQEGSADEINRILLSFECSPQ